MSLLNNMFKDLEKRRATKADEQVPDALKSFAKRRLPRWLPITVILVIVVVIIVAVLLIDAKSINSKPEELLKPKALQIRNMKPKVTEVKQFGWSYQKNLGLLTISLSKAAHYQLEHDGNKRQVTLILLDSQMGNIKLPTIEENPLLAAINVSKANKTVTLKCKLKEQVHLQAIELTRGKGSKILVKITPSSAALEKIQAEATKVPPTTEELALIDYEKAIKFANNGDKKQAINLLNQSLSKKTNFWKAREILATLLLEQGNFAKANQVIEAGLTISPENIALITLKAQRFVKQHQDKAALALLRQFSPTLRNHTQFYGLIAALEQKLGHTELAGEYYAQLAKVEPNQAKWWLGRGIALEAQNKRQAAYQAYYQAMVVGGLSPNLQVFIQSRMSRLKD